MEKINIYENNEDDNNYSNGINIYENNEDDNSFIGFNEELVLEESSIELILEHVSKMNKNQKNEFIASEEFKILSEAGKFTKNTIISLNKEDDLKKRTSLIAINIEKEKNSALYKKYEAARKKMLDIKQEIIDKNYTKASKLASKQLKSFIKSVDTSKIPLTTRVLDNKAK